MAEDNEPYEPNERELAELVFSPVCNLCKYFSVLGTIDKGIHICTAFPNGIPDEIWRGENKHTKPYPGDHGIQFEQSYAAE